MGYYPTEKKGVITPPKNGTNTVMAIATAIYMCKEGRPGPLKYADVTDYLVRTGERLEDYEFAMAIRDPADRLVSMINYKNNTLHGKVHPADFETAMSRSYNEPDVWLYRPQTYYWHPDKDPEILVFQNVSDLGTWMGWMGPTPRENVGPKHWTKEQIMDHKYWDDLIKLYDEDYKLPFKRVS